MKYLKLLTIIIYYTHNIVIITFEIIGISSPRSTSVYGGKLPSPRAITVKVHTDAQAPDHVATVLVMSWGQFLDHDISHTALSKFKNEGIYFLPQQLYILHS